MTDISPLTVTNPLGPLESFGLKLLAIVLLIGGVYLWGHHRGDAEGFARGDAGRAAVQAKWDEDRQRMTQAALTATEHHEQNEAAIAADTQRIQHDAQVKDAQLAAARADSAAAHRSLLDAARAAAANPRGGEVDGHSAPLVGRGLPGVSALDLQDGVRVEQPDPVIVTVLDGVDAAAGDLADYADVLAGRLGACRAQYESVRTHSGD